MYVTRDGYKHLYYKTRRRLMDKQEKKIRLCVVCDKPLGDHIYRTQTVCSDECKKARKRIYNELNKKDPNSPKNYSNKTCIKCGELFKPSSSGDRYCSAECKKSTSKIKRVNNSKKSKKIPEKFLVRGNIRYSEGIRYK